MEIREISEEECLPIRQGVLRKGKPMEDCVFEGDKLDSTFHFGIFDPEPSGEKLLGIVSLMANKNPHFHEGNQYQLRGMAVLPEAQRQGLASLLLEKAEKRLHGEKTEILWCNARKKAVGFYEKHGFKTLGNAFEIPEIGWHFLMYKYLGSLKDLGLNDIRYRTKL